MATLLWLNLAGDTTLGLFHEAGSWLNIQMYKVLIAYDSNTESHLHDL